MTDTEDIPWEGTDPAGSQLAAWGRVVRLQVARLMRREAELLAPGVEPGAQTRWLLWGHRHEEAQAALDALGLPTSDQLEARIAGLREAMAARLAEVEAGVRLPLEDLRAGFRLSPLELGLLVAAAMPTFDPQVAELYARAGQERWAEAGWLARLVARDAAQEAEALAHLGDGGALTRYRLLVPLEAEGWGGLTPRSRAPLAVPQRVLGFMAGRSHEQAAAPGCRLWREARPLDSLVVDDAVLRRLGRALQRRQARICLYGPRHSGRASLLGAFCVEAQGRMLEVELERALSERGEGLREALAEVLREARLHGAPVLLRADALEDTAERRQAFLHHASDVLAVIEDFPGPLFVTATRPTPWLARWLGESLEVVLDPPGPQGQARLWNEALAGLLDDEARDALVERMAGAYRLAAGGPARAVTSAVAQLKMRGQRPGRGLDAALLAQAVRRQLDHGLSWYAEVVTDTATLDELVLPDAQVAQFDELLAFARHADRVFEGWGFGGRGQEGRGLSALFSGSPGTGKTMAAAAVAHALGRALYRVDLSRVVDRFIGQTEKNLGRIFDEAERAQAVLLFDEADSLFARRTAISSGHDRYANIEVNFLLQRMETYDGVCVLTTNLANAIDESFMRRLRFKIAFPMPGVRERARLWRQLLPPGAPLAQDIDWKKLAARFEFSGGVIRNAAIRAGVYAAERGVEIDHALLLEAASAEGRAMGLLVRE